VLPLGAKRRVCPPMVAGYTDRMFSTEVLQIFERHNVPRGALQARLRLAESASDHDVATMLRAALLIFEQAEHESNSAPRVTHVVPAW
jgi:hypothetical protein